MTWVESVVLGIIQGLTELLPVSSSGHLTIAGTIFGLSGEENLAFAILVHIATVLSTVIVLWREISVLFKGLLMFRWNSDTKMVSKILLSMLPVGIVGVFFKDWVEAFFGSGLLLVGCMLLLTAVLLLLSYYYPSRKYKEEISFRDALIIGCVQACAVLPGLSRSGSTIAAGVWLGNNKEKVAKFSFLMVILPVLGEALLDGMKMLHGNASTFNTISVPAMIGGFAAAFLSGLFACKWMIGIVKRGKLNYFAFYCIVVGLFVIINALIR
jgi:undecaprenyl-diphosphatase